jgi:RNA polymerase sigma factor (sigma-70 family)
MRVFMDIEGVEVMGDDGEQTVSSFSAFYERNYHAAVRLSAALVHRWEVAEELAQDAFVTLHARWDQVSTYESPEAWLRRVVVNRSVSALRRSAIEVRLVSRLSRQRVRNYEIPSPDDTLWRTVARLPKRQAQVAVLMFVDDLTVGETAAVLECDENTVRTHLRRARITLAKRLDLNGEA